MSKITEILEKAGSNAYGEDSEAIAALAGIMMAITFEKGSGPFICGTSGEKDSLGLHEGYVICPMYGADIQCSGFYKRVRTTDK